jgi:hypothetical protein
MIDKMRFILISFFLVGMILMESCQKENTVENPEGYIHTVVSDSDMAVMASFEVNGNYLVIGRDYFDEHPGLIVKLDNKGKEIWKKRLSPLNRVLWKVVELPGTGFITLGHCGNNFMTACTYDNDGNLISSANINIPTGTNAGSCAPSDIIKLKNGNFAISGLDGNGFLGYLIITNDIFDSLFTKVFNLPHNSFGNVFGLVEMPDSSIVIRTATTEFGPVVPYSNILLIRTDLTGILKSSTRVLDTLNSETPNCIIAKDNAMLVVASKMEGWNSGNGFYVNYNNNLYGYISGRINLISFTLEGQLVSRKIINSYSGNGMINSIKPTSDGGYVLCGTVNQNHSSTLVSKTKIYLLKLDTNLNEQWSKTFNTSYQSFGIDAFQSSDGGYVVTGHEHSFDSKYNMMVIKTDYSGNVY